MLSRSLRTLVLLSLFCLPVVASDDLTDDGYVLTRKSLQAYYDTYAEEISKIRDYILVLEKLKGDNSAEAYAERKATVRKLDAAREASNVAKDVIGNALAPQLASKLREDRLKAKYTMVVCGFTDNFLSIFYREPGKETGILSLSIQLSFEKDSKVINGMKIEHLVRK